MRKLLLASIAVVALLSACASPASMQNLSAAQQEYARWQARCSQGDVSACSVLPIAGDSVAVAQAQVSNEQSASAAIGLGVLAIGLGALDAATCCNYGYHYHYAHNNWHHW